MTKAIIALLRALGAGQVSAQTGSVDDSAKAEGGAFAVEPLHTRESMKHGLWSMRTRPAA